MAFREWKPPKQKRNSSLAVGASPTKIFIDNGGTADIAWPCFYLKVPRPIPAQPHSRLLHDHLGWPSPDRPDRSCQDTDFAAIVTKDGRHRRYKWVNKYLDMSRLIPIHLRREGYSEEVLVSVLEAPDGLTWEAWIDPDKDWIVRVVFYTEEDTAVTESVHCMYSIRLQRGTGVDKRVNVLTRGRLTILPSVIDLDEEL